MNISDNDFRSLINKMTSHQFSAFVRSFKFGRKINYVSYLSELENVVKCEQLIIPTRVRE